MADGQPEAEGQRWKPSPLLQVSAGLHLASAAALAAMPGAWPWILGALLLDHAVLSAAGTLPRSRLLGGNLTHLPAGDARVALTFDDGPDPEVTPQVLDLLDEYGASASFFVIGERAEAHRDLTAEIARRGYRLENHTYSHSNLFAFRSPWALGREIDRAQASLRRFGDRTPLFFRAPAGIRNPWLDPVLARRRLALTSWTRRGFDTVDRRPRRILRRLLEDLGAGDILLLHDGNAARDRRGRPVVLEVLPRLLDALDERELRGVALPDSAGVSGRSRAALGLA